MEVTTTSSVPLCACGCGKPVGVYARTTRAQGAVKGQPCRLVRGHREKQFLSSALYLRTQSNGIVRGLHVAIAEKALGKPLPPGAQVHHFDCNKKNNANSNLVICQDAKYHRLLHVRQRVKAAGGDPNTQRICSSCKQLKFFHELEPRKCASCLCRLCRRVYSSKANMRRRLEKAAHPRVSVPRASGHSFSLTRNVDRSWVGRCQCGAGDDNFATCTVARDWHRNHRARQKERE